MPSEREPGSESASSDPEDLLADAYRQRTAQLYQARSVLAETVAVLTQELREERREASATRQQNATLLEQTGGLRQALQSSELRADSLRAELDATLSVLSTLQAMKVVRWSAPVRGFVYRRRARRK